jgi:hypothetical protein
MQKITNKDINDNEQVDERPVIRQVLGHVHYRSTFGIYFIDEVDAIDNCATDTPRHGNR